MKNENKFDIKEGTVSFWTKPGQIDFSGNQIMPMIQFDSPNGSIFIVKDDDKKIKFFHVYLGKGRTDVEHDVSGLDPKTEHMFAFTWSIKERSLNIYIDGELKNTTKIDYIK
ncbi:MAG: LamG-like jellyroll fold domain-containing protein [bacterium]|nr:LamG-like jellyroll fold domain-containing protein [bacterium]